MNTRHFFGGEGMTPAILVEGRRRRLLLGCAAFGALCLSLVVSHMGMGNGGGGGGFGSGRFEELELPPAGGGWLLLDQVNPDAVVSPGLMAERPEIKVANGNQPVEEAEPSPPWRGPLSTWQQDATMNGGTFVQGDESAKLIYPWARNSHAYDPREHVPSIGVPSNDWITDDDQPREVVRGRSIWQARQ